MRPVRTDAEAPPPPPKPTPAPPPPETEEPSDGWFPYQKLVGFAVGGTGVALLTAGITSLAAGASLRSATQDNVDAHNAAYGTGCSTGDYVLCSLDVQLINEDGERADSLQTAGLGMTIVGGVLTATGVVFLVFAPWGDEETATSDTAPARAGESTARAPTSSRKVACGPYGLPGFGCVGTF
jgi:hypothetical protein